VITGETLLTRIAALTHSETERQGRGESSLHFFWYMGKLSNNLSIPVT
jgi:hypothetical protein